MSSSFGGKKGRSGTSSDILNLRKQSVIAAANSTATGKVLQVTSATSSAVTATKTIGATVATVAASISTTVNPTTKAAVVAVTTKTTSKH